jgi:tetratricopeptide (TPR) repeat protein
MAPNLRIYQPDLIGMVSLCEKAVVSMNAIINRLAFSATTVAVLGILASLPLGYAQSPSNSLDVDSQTMFDALDPFDYFGSGDQSSVEDKDKSADELLREGYQLFRAERLLDGRTKLLKALQKDPKNVKAHYLLAGYYISSVGHYRLAMRHAKRSLELLVDKHGKPPYPELSVQRDHSTILNYLSQIRLNLDNYQGALDTLDEFTSYGYVDEGLPSSRAWILMKLGRLPEAIKVARLGLLLSQEPGRNLNMLGILLSMDDQRQEAIDVFKKAIRFEFSQGSTGQPATPLNNVGEVYREMFEDDKAEASFSRAAGLPDGCEHFLPTLNLVLLYIEQMKFQTAASTIDAFQQCMAQFPLRNDEEYGALLKLARGRIDLHTGHIDRAIRRFENAIDGTQWFGKIGTNQNDLVAAVNFSLAQALERKNNLIVSHRPTSWEEWYTLKKEKISNKLKAWWHMRRSRQVLTEELADLEDLSIRNTDSLLEYPTLGEALKGLSRASLLRRLESQRKVDTRGPAQAFYDLYEAEASLDWWHRSDGLKLLDQVISQARPRFDELLRTQALVRRMELLSPDTSHYRDLAYRVFSVSRAELRNRGLAFPVNIDTQGASKALSSTLMSSLFVQSDGPGTRCSIKATSDTDGKHRIAFSCDLPAIKSSVAEDKDPHAVVNKVTDSIFTEDISNGGNS